VSKKVTPQGLALGVKGKLIPLRDSVSNISCLRHRDTQVCRLLEERPRAAHKGSPFGLKIKRAGISCFSRKNSATEPNND
jgi:hypothetical protein